MAQTPENLNQTNIELQIPKEILEGIENHVTKTFESNKSILLVDIESKDKETYIEIGRDITEILSEYLEENFIETNGYTDIVDLATKYYPEKKIFVLTTTDHLAKHDLSTIMQKFEEKRNVIKKYEKRNKYYVNYYLVGINLTKPYVIGVSTHLYSIDDEQVIKDIAKKISKRILNKENLTLDKLESVGGAYGFAIFRKEWRIYRNQPILKYRFIELTNYDDLKENYIGVKTEWLTFVEVSRSVIMDLFDP